MYHISSRSQWNLVSLVVLQLKGLRARNFLKLCFLSMLMRSKDVQQLLQASVRSRCVKTRGRFLSERSLLKPCSIALE